MSVQIPGYKIIRPIGRGGMATVYLAEQEIFEREVALKVMSRSLADDPSFGQRFFREAKIVSRLVHPNIVTVHDVGEYEGFYYLSMEHIDGGDLKLGRKRLTFRQKITALKDIAKALQYAATKGYVHRDIKPENIMFHLSDGRAVLTDFGIARAAETGSSVTQTGVAIGTPHYMSPEQAKGQMVDHRADIYSLGVVLYLLVAGRVPYDAESAVAIGIKHITDPVPQLPEIMRDLQPVLDKMMAKSPDDRYQSAAYLINALDALDMPALEKTSLVLEQVLRDQAELIQTADDESPTLVSAPMGVVRAPSGSQAIVPGAAPPPKKTGQKDNIHNTAPRPAIVDTQINESIVEESPDDDEPERFTVIYDTEIGALDDVKPARWPWFFGLMLIAGGAAGYYFYEHPNDWDKVVIESQSLLAEAKVKVNDLVNGEQESSGSPNIETPVEETPRSEPASLPTTGIANENAPVVESEDINADASSDTSTVVDDARVDGVGDSLEEGSETLQVEQQITQIEERVESLRGAVLNDSAFLPELVTAYRELLTLAPENEEAESGLTTIRDSEISKILSLVDDAKIPAARKKLSQLGYLFPELEADQIAKIESRINQREELESLLAKASTLQAEEKMTEPENENALAYFQKVLEKYPDEARAISGVRKISNYFLSRADSAFENDDIETAESEVKKSLEVDWKNEEAVSLLEKIRNLQEKNAEQNSLFVQAEESLEAGKYFEPVRDNAYHYYAKVLEFDSGNASAIAGVDMTIEAFSAWVWALVGERKFNEAKAAFVAPLNMLPNEARIKDLNAAVNSVIEDQLSANKAAISRLVVSGKEQETIPARQAEAIKARAAVFVMFSYENFPVEPVSVQVKLMDGAGNIEIAQTSVQTEASSGVAKFRLDSPVGSFPIGLYSLVVSRDAEILNSTVFSVE